MRPQSPWFKLLCSSVFCALLALTFAPFAGADPLLAEQPLAAPSGPRGATMFTLLPPERTGIVTENPYDDPRMWGERYQQFVYGAIGTGIAVGDYDGDGRPDIFVVNKTGQGRLFRNLGDWHFEDVTEKAGLSGASQNWTEKAKGWLGLGGASSDSGPVWSQGATFVDVNNDGLLDLYICRFAAPNLLYINQGDGTFKEEAGPRGVAVNDASNMAAFCDYDRDGFIDLYLQTNLLDAQAHPIGQRDYLFHNNGNGTFTDVSARAGIAGETQGHSAIWWDFDNDGWPDLYVANDFAVPDFLYRNNHDGTFTNVIDHAIPHMPLSSMGADLGDVNNDGLIDFIVADMAATTREKDQRGMAKIRLELNRREANPGSSPQYMRNALYINTGTGRFLEAAQLTGLAATDWTWSVRLEDLDNDGWLDAFFTNGMVRELHNIDIEQRVSGSESVAEQIRVMKDSPVMAESHLAFRNLGDLRFEEVSHAWGLDQKGVSFGAAFGDFDGDGDLDLIYANYQGGVTVLRNDSDSGHRLVVALHGTRSNRFGIGATVEIETVSGVQVRPLVLARGYLSSSEPILHFGLGDNTQVKRLTVRWPSGAIQNFAALAVDRRYTITEPASVAPLEVAPVKPLLFTDQSIKMGFSLSAREKPELVSARDVSLSFRLDHRGPSLAVGALGEGGHDDVILGGTTADTMRVLDPAQHGSYVLRDLPGLPQAIGAVDDGPILIFDANGDGYNDVLMTKNGGGQPAGSPLYKVQLMLNDGHGRFQSAPEGTLPELNISVGAAVAGDFDHDGRLDVFLGARLLPGKFPLSPRSFLLANRAGKFVDVTDQVAPGLREVGIVTSALWSDVDGDGWLDLVVAIDWGGVKYFHNDHQGHLEDWSARAGFSNAGNGWWTSLASADFNEDGRPDFVVGNVGLNTAFRASVESPAVLFYGSFSNGAAPQVIGAFEEGGQLYPRRTRGDLGGKIPTLLKRFPRNDDYAQATLEQIVGTDRLAAAKKYTAVEFRSGVFLSQPDGTYLFTPLPRIAQISPFEGVVALDLNGDGHADIYAAQNSFSPFPSIGHFDGGLSQLLLGDGRGHFTPVPPAESNLIVPGDARAVAVTDFDGDGRPDLLITRNDATTLAFHNEGSPHHHSLCVQLFGPNGNLSAVGARVTLESNQGATQTVEVSAGSGVATQSTASCFFGYLDDATPRLVRVRWPTGETSDSLVPANTTVLAIRAPHQ